METQAGAEVIALVWTFLGALGLAVSAINLYSAIGTKAVVDRLQRNGAARIVANSGVRGAAISVIIKVLYLTVGVVTLYLQGEALPSTPLGILAAIVLTFVSLLLVVDDVMEIVDRRGIRHAVSQRRADDPAEVSYERAP